MHYFRPRYFQCYISLEYRPQFFFYFLFGTKGKYLFGLKQLKNCCTFFFGEEAGTLIRATGIIPWDKHSLYDPIEDTSL